MTPLPMTPSTFLESAVLPALDLLPSKMNSPEAQVMLVSIAQQESGLKTRTQYNGGPARGLLQFELGTQASKGGVWGIYLHSASRYWLNSLCQDRGVQFDPVAIYNTLATDDILAAGLGRLALFVDPKPLPSLSDKVGSWALYQRVWRPGQPRPDTWPDYYSAAVSAVEAVAA